MACFEGLVALDVDVAEVEPNAAANRAIDWVEHAPAFRVRELPYPRLGRELPVLRRRSHSRQLTRPVSGDITARWASTGIHSELSHALLGPDESRECDLPETVLVQEEDGFHAGRVSTYHGEVEVKRLVDDRLTANHALRWVRIDRHAQKPRAQNASTR